MAKLRYIPTHGPIRGKLDDRIYKWYGNKCVVQKLPTRRKRRRVTAKLKAAFANMREAVLYAQGVLADPKARAYYATAARTLRTSIYHLAKADAMKPPTVATSIVARCYEGRAGEVISVQTGDLFRVQALRVTFRDAAGDIVETGAATRSKKTFVYTLKREHPHGEVLSMEVFAESRVGHQVSAVQSVSRRK